MNKIEQKIKNGGDYTVGMNGVAVVNNTFWADFSIAESFGQKAVEETFKRAFSEWKKDIEYITALAIVMNHKGWKWYGVDENSKLAKWYFERWQELDAFILACEGAGTDEETYKNFTKEEVEYFILATD